MSGGIDVDLSKKKYETTYGGNSTVKERRLDEEAETYLDQVDAISEQVKNEINTGAFLLSDDAKVFDPSIQAELKARIENIIISKKLGVSGYDRDKLVRDVANRITSFGPLADLLLIEDLNDIVINSKDEVFIKVKGSNEWEKTDVRFKDDKEVLRIGNNLLFSGGSGRAATTRTPDVTGPGPFKTRINITTKPLADHTTIAIRKQREEHFNLEQLVDSGMLTEGMANLSRCAVIAKVNLIVLGPTRSGKTTLARSFIDEIPESERLITIERQKEWHIERPNTVQLQARYTGSPETTITEYDLCEKSMYKSPDRILVGEIIGKEADVFLFALNNGHEGSFTTGHAKSIEHGLLHRLPFMISKSGINMDKEEIRSEICSTLELAYFTSFLGGIRRVTSIAEIIGYKGNGKVELNEIYRFDIERAYRENGRPVVEGKFNFIAKPKGPVAQKLFEAGFSI